MIHTLLLLLMAHAVADYPLQGDFLARAKNVLAPLPGVPWYQAMGAHCAIHAGFVYLVTGSAALAAAEFVCHWTIDTLKCTGRLSFNADQAAHVGCKVVWAAIAGGVAA
jgi:hypothetical protein